MNILDLVQGSDEWHEARIVRRTASEAAAMMGDSPKMTRNQLLQLKKTGVTKEVSAWVKKNLFDKGHAVEAQARALLEDELGIDLFPITAEDDKGYLLMSSDGIDIGHTFMFEHKMWNEELAKAVRNGELWPEHYWQLEQQLLITGAEFVTFMVSDGTAERRESFDYFPVEGRADQLLAGWLQFDKDLENFVPVVAKEAVVADKIAELPQLVVKLSGGVSASNMKDYKAGALSFIEAINTTLVTDKDFVNAEAAVKFCEKAEKELKDVKTRALSETASIKELFETIDELSAAVRAKRLTLSKLVETQKKALKEGIVNKGLVEFNKFIADINAEIGPRIQMPEVPIDLAGVISGKRNLDSIQNAVDTEIARAKIEANDIATRIRGNLKTLRELPQQHVPLFRDVHEHILKAADDFANLVTLRVNEFEQAEAERLRQKEIDEEAIRQKERDRIEEERKENERLEAERLEAEAIANAKGVNAAREAAPEILKDQSALEQVVSDAVTTGTGAAIVGATGTVTRVAPEDLRQEPVATQAPGESEYQPVPLEEYVTQAVAEVGTGDRKRTVTATLENFAALVRAVADGELPLDLLTINAQAVRDFVEEHNYVPTGFTLGSS